MANGQGNFGPDNAGPLWVYLYGGSNGTPTYSGTCAVTQTQSGAQTSPIWQGYAGTVTVNGSACTGRTIILTFGYSALRYWACAANDITSGTAAIRQTARTSTSATLTVTTGSSDVIDIMCRPI